MLLVAAQIGILLLLFQVVAVTILYFIQHRWPCRQENSSKRCKIIHLRAKEGNPKATCRAKLHFEKVMEHASEYDDHQGYTNDIITDATEDEEKYTVSEVKKEPQWITGTSEKKNVTPEFYYYPCDVSSSDNESSTDESRNSTFSSSINRMNLCDDLFGLKTPVVDACPEDRAPDSLNSGKSFEELTKRKEDKRTELGAEAYASNAASEEDNLSSTLSDISLGSFDSDLSLTAELEANREENLPENLKDSDSSTINLEGTSIISTLVSYFNDLNGITKNRISDEDQSPSKVFRGKVTESFFSADDKNNPDGMRGQNRNVNWIPNSLTLDDDDDDEGLNFLRRSKNKTVHICAIETEAVMDRKRMNEAPSEGCITPERSNSGSKSKVETSESPYLGRSPAKSLISSPMNPVYLISPISSPLRNMVTPLRDGCTADPESPGVKERINKYEESIHRSNLSLSPAKVDAAEGFQVPGDRNVEQIKEFTQHESTEEGETFYSSDNEAMDTEGHSDVEQEMITQESAQTEINEEPVDANHIMLESDGSHETNDHDESTEKPDNSTTDPSAETSGLKTIEPSYERTESERIHDVAKDAAEDVTTKMNKSDLLPSGTDETRKTTYEMLVLTKGKGFRPKERSPRKNYSEQMLQKKYCSILTYTSPESRTKTLRKHSELSIETGKMRKKPVPNKGYSRNHLKKNKTTEMAENVEWKEDVHSSKAFRNMPKVEKFHFNEKNLLVKKN